MKRPSKKEVYESIDILSKEMVRQYFKENKDKLFQEVESELEAATTKKGQKEQKETEENKENKDLLLASFGIDEELNSNRNIPEKDLTPKVVRSSNTIRFIKELSKQNSINNLKKLNLNENKKK